MMVRGWGFALVVSLALSCGASEDEEPRVVEVGPTSGTLLLAGGGPSDEPFLRFMELCGGPDTNMVVIQTARADEDLDPDIEATYEASFGLTRVTAVHTREPAEANSEAFTAPIDAAECVWFTGGRQWRIADAYLDTATADALWRVLERGGSIGGTSAGASIQASFLARGDTWTNYLILGDHTEGLGYLRNAAVDQHVTERDREYELIQILELDPTILGIGLDEDTWIEVEGDIFTTAGAGQVFIHDVGNWPENPEDPEEQIIRLDAGARYDMGRRLVLSD